MEYVTNTVERHWSSHRVRAAAHEIDGAEEWVLPALDVVALLPRGLRNREIAAELGCDSLRYLSLEGVYEAIRSTRETHCDACFTGEYPLERTESANGKFALEQPERTPARV